MLKVFLGHPSKSGDEVGLQRAKAFFNQHLTVDFECKEVAPGKDWCGIMVEVERVENLKDILEMYNFQFDQKSYLIYDKDMVLDD